MCLSLPESTDRRAAFDQDNRYGFAVFPGLRHRMGWVGCAMSYKLIIKRAMDLHRKQLLVCEDDVYFPPNFEERFEKILAYVEEHRDWDIFSGVIAELRAKLLDCCQQEDETYVYLDRMVSLVFSIYNESVYETLANWDSSNTDVQTNTIDRYLERKKLRILTTCPFLVGHKEDLNSTIWGAQNTIYTDWLTESSRKLAQMVDEYRNRAENAEENA